MQGIDERFCSSKPSELAPPPATSSTPLPRRSRSAPNLRTTNRRSTPARSCFRTATRFRRSFAPSRTGCCGRRQRAAARRAALSPAATALAACFCASSSNADCGWPKKQLSRNSQRPRAAQCLQLFPVCSCSASSAGRSSAAMRAHDVCAQTNAPAGSAPACRSSAPKIGGSRTPSSAHGSPHSRHARACSCVASQRFCDAGE